MKKSMRTILMVMIGIIIFGGIALATTYLTDSQINTPFVNVTSTTDTNTTISIRNYGSDNSLKITPQANTSASSSVGGAILLDNSKNTGAGIVVYTTMNDSSNGHLITARINNKYFDNSAIYATSLGTSHTAVLLYTGNDTGSSALNLVSLNSNYSAMSVTGNETSHGTIKISHTYPGRSDANAAALSINLADLGTAAQGIYVYSDGNTTGDLLSLNNFGRRFMSVNSSGGMALSRLSARSIVDVNGTITTDYISFNVNTLPTCNAATNSSMGRNATGVYGCSGGNAWTKLY
jgi:hypothetical protein